MWIEYNLEKLIEYKYIIYFIIVVYLLGLGDILIVLFL